MAIGDLLAQINGEPSTPTSETPRTQPLPKRKADTELPRSNGKHVKTEQTPANSSRPMDQAKSLSNGNSNSSKIKPEARPYKVTTHPKGYGYGHVDLTDKTPDPSKPRPPPKKGSHAEIMARAVAAQKTVGQGQVGKIQHKAIEKGASRMTGRSAGGASWAKANKIRPSDEKDVKTGRPGEKNAARGGTAKPKASANGGKAAAHPEEPVKKIKKAATATTGYTGTARPNPSLTRVNSRANISSTASPRRDSVPSSRLPSSSRYEESPRRYRYADDEEEDEDEDEEYDSDASSDMEAAAYEVDEEEEMALRIAKREDIEEERRLKREQEEKRKRLAARAAGR